MSQTLDKPYEKDPESDEPIGIDLDAYLIELGDGITLASVTADVKGPDNAMTVHDEGVAGNRVFGYIAGGTRGGVYAVEFRFVTTGSPPVRDKRSITVRVKER